uniref:Uncharacterized protein n=1 Tax=viral metagenome TaxID=1070528 RepID=A0A6H1ZD40_9ZZZZ
MGRDSTGDTLGTDADTLAQPAGIVWADLVEGTVAHLADTEHDADEGSNAHAEYGTHAEYDACGHVDTDGNADAHADLDADSYADSYADEHADSDAYGDNLRGEPARAAGDDAGLDAAGIDATTCDNRSKALQPARDVGGGAPGSTGNDGVYHYQAEVGGEGYGRKTVAQLERGGQ